MILFQGLNVATAACPTARNTAASIYESHKSAIRLYSSAGWGDLMLSRFRGGLRSVQRNRYPSERLQPGQVSPQLQVPAHIPRPDYVRCSTPAGAPRLSKHLELHDQQGRDAMRAAGQLAARALQLAGSLIKPGVTTAQLDRAVHEFITSHGAYPSPLHYCGFPKSICTSVNEVVCHGIPDSRPLNDGDIVNVDVTVYSKGYHGDTNATFFVGDPSSAATELVDVTRSCLTAAIGVCGPGVPLRTIGHIIQEIAEAAGMSVIRDFVGHGIGKTFHAAPAILHHCNWRPGNMQLHQTFTIEPIISLGTSRHHRWADNWTEVTSDGSLTAQFEHTLLITETGADILTQVTEQDSGKSDIAHATCV